MWDLNFIRTKFFNQVYRMFYLNYVGFKPAPYVRGASSDSGFIWTMWDLNPFNSPGGLFTPALVLSELCGI